MATELDKLATKNTKQQIEEAHKNLNKKEQKLKSQARKAPDFGSATKISTSIGDVHVGYKDPTIIKGLKTIKRVRKKIKKQEERLEKHGVWDKNKGSAWASREKKKIIEKGFPSKAKMAGGGIALRGLGRAFRGGGKV